MQLFFWFALILYIPLNHTSISSFPYIYNIIAIRPKLTTPQISFQIRLPLKQFPRYYAFSNKAHFLRHELIPQLIALFCADDIITISRSSMRDIKRCFRRGNVATLPFNLAPVTTPKPKRIKRQFVYVGGDDPRKRIDNLGKAFAQFYSEHPDYKLILIGRADPRFDPALYRLSQQEGVDSTGYISESEKLRVIAESTALIYPSLYEGFGLAIAEGIQADVPVLAGDGGAQKEVGKDAVLRIDPQNVDTILAGMETVLLPEVQEKLREARIAQRRILVGPHNAQIIVDYFTRQVVLARRIN